MPRLKTISLNNEKYKKISLIGQGGFGSVYLIENSENGERLAYKEQEYDGYDFSENEAKIMKNFDNSNVVKVFDFGSENVDPLKHWYIMEYTQLNNIRSLIGKKYDIIASCDLLLQILNGLKYIHDQGYIHRDLKPENILLFENNILKITDFGLIKKVDESTRSVISFKGSGTQRYMAPELFEFKRASIKSDIYALGVLFFELLSGGELPYHQNIADWFNVHDSPIRKDISEFRNDIDWKDNWRLAKIVKKLCKPNTNERYENCDQIISEIHELIAKSTSFIPDTILKRSYDINSGIEQEKIEEKMKEQKFENKKLKITQTCRDFIDTLENTIVEFNKYADVPLNYTKDSRKLNANFNNRFLAFDCSLVCNSLDQEEDIYDKIERLKKYNNLKAYDIVI